MDATGDMEFTLWNNDTDLVETLELKENDTIKIIKARAQTDKHPIKNLFIFFLQN
jgi:replication factor A1